MQRTKNSASLLLKLLETDTVRLEAAEKKLEKTLLIFIKVFGKTFYRSLARAIDVNIILGSYI
ncbi:hypothetical protein TCARB_0714 [Thermofilum adornatum 1505]|uniref:Uncharacterized protein n=1 Tax=Thermofilum adornatum 1505 TaxID=697581 RepID=A0A3G1A6J2_9CREN|nr:hypothetical protein [Thermofilum adornatum]AJB41768.1 hypothetical protein TCARB_0714 [Thermofilum adornatum 1505]